MTEDDAPVAESPRPRAGSRVRTALITTSCVAVVIGVVLILVLTRHRSADSATHYDISVPAMTFHVTTVINIPIPVDSVLDPVNDPGCSSAEDALATATDKVGHDISDQAASVADAQKALDQADDAATAAQSPALKTAVSSMKTHLVALRSAAGSKDFTAEASAFRSLQGDITAVFAACRP